VTKIKRDTESRPERVEKKIAVIYGVPLGRGGGVVAAAIISLSLFC